VNQFDAKTDTVLLGGSETAFFRSLLERDPSRTIQNLNALKSQNLTALKTAGRLVRGVSADGVTQVLVRIPVSTPGRLSNALYSTTKPGSVTSC
jgi:hypothetical protein